MAPKDSLPEGIAAGESDKQHDFKEDFDWHFDFGVPKHSSWRVVIRKGVHAMRSAFLLDLITEGLPIEQRGLLYYTFITFHEDFSQSLYVYSGLPAILMWYYPSISPRTVYTITKIVDVWKRKDMLELEYVEPFVPSISQLVYKTFFRVDLRGVTPLFEAVFGPASTWSAAITPMFVGLNFRFFDECPLVMNGSVPENMDGIWMALLARASTAVAPLPVQWAMWSLYTVPSIEYPSMFVDWLVCTFSWILTGASPAGTYALWLIVNQYCHAETWFRYTGAGPSVILRRERRGTICYITTIVVSLILEHAFGSVMTEDEFWTLSPQVWIPLVLILFAGLYRSSYVLMLRTYKYRYVALPKGKHIRLLRLRAQPCSPNAMVQCDIICSTLWHPPPYVAVSHRWDNASTPQEPILINGGLFSVSRSIHSLLLKKRSVFRHRYFWIDSICINQDDVVEKNRQVGIMRNIFEEAEKVIGWLGDDINAKEALDLAEKICDVKNVEAYRRLREEASRDWAKFEKLTCNEFFERVWIIQELCVGQNRTLCYGGQEIRWDEFVRALGIVLQYSFLDECSASCLIHRRESINVLMIDEIRTRVLNVNLIQLKDVLKLGLGFKASLAVDKVFALLGLANGRHTPLFHRDLKNFSFDGDRRVHNAYQIVRGIVEVLQPLLAIRRTARGMQRSRRARVILSSGTDNAAKYVAGILQNLERLTSMMEAIPDGSDAFDEDLLQLDYSKTNTAQTVYTLAARDLIKQNDALSFLKFAGIRNGESRDLTGLPSWVPDWSQDLNTYVLPWIRRENVGDTNVNKPQETPTQQDPIVRDGGAFLMFIKGRIVDTVKCSTMLTSDYDVTQSEGSEATGRDFTTLRANFNIAFQFVQDFVKLPDQTEAELEKAFYRTIAAGSDLAGRWAATLMCPWIIEAGFPTPMSHWSDDFQQYWREMRDSKDPDQCKCDQEEAVAKYAFVRKTNSSANSKFAHLIRARMVPSSVKHRRMQSPPKTRLSSSVLEDESHDLLSLYDPYVDYTINRSFIVTSLGSMGLAPPTTKPGDVIFQVETKVRITWFILREEQYPDPAPTSSTASSAQPTDASNKPETSSQPRVNPQPPAYGRTFRLVGEAFVHSLNDNSNPNTETEWVRLW